MSILRQFINQTGFRRTIKSFIVDFKFFILRISFPARFFFFRCSAKSRFNRLHLGCGSRLVTGWINVDTSNSDLQLNLGNAYLPFPDSSIRAVVMQHVLEHLYLESQAVPLLFEINRVLCPSSAVYLSVPDLSKLCHSYVDNLGKNLLSDKLTRWPIRRAFVTSLPAQHIINDIFYQSGNHHYMYDFSIIEHLLKLSGFSNVYISCESDFLTEFPEFPARNDDIQALYVKAVK